MGGLLACASVAIGLSEDQGLTVTNPLLWQQQENTSVSQSHTHTEGERLTFRVLTLVRLENTF